MKGSSTLLKELLRYVTYLSSHEGCEHYLKAIKLSWSDTDGGSDGLFSPSPSSSRSSWRSCGAGHAPHAAGDWHSGLRTCYTVSPPASRHPSVCSRRWCSLCGTCGRSSSPTGGSEEAAAGKQRSHLRSSFQIIWQWVCMWKTLKRLYSTLGKTTKVAWYS